MEGTHAESGRARRIATTVVAAAVAVITFGALGGIGLAKSPLTAAQYQYGKVTICHKAGPHGKRVTITVSRNALPAHMAHGDTVGPCPSTSRAKSKQKAQSKQKAAAPKQKAGAERKAAAPKAETKQKTDSPKAETKQKDRGDTKAKEKSSPAAGPPAAAPAEEKADHGKAPEDKGGNGKAPEDTGGNGKGRGKG